MFRLDVFPGPEILGFSGLGCFRNLFGTLITYFGKDAT